MLQLKMEASQDVLAGAGLIVLDEMKGKASFLERSFVPCFRKPAAVVGKDSGAQPQDSWQAGRKNFHTQSVSSWTAGERSKESRRIR